MVDVCGKNKCRILISLLILCVLSVDVENFIQKLSTCNGARRWRKSLKEQPLSGEYYLHDGKVYCTKIISRGTDEITLANIEDGSRWSVRYSVFKYGFVRVWKIGEVSRMLERSPRSIYRYEQREQIQNPKRYNSRGGKTLRFYTKQEVLEIHEMICEIAQGRPREDKKIVNNTLPNRASLLAMFRERYGE